MEKKLQNICLTYYNVFIAQDLRHGHYEILSIIFLKYLIKLNVNTDMVIKNVKPAELNISLATIVLNIQILKMT